MVHFAARIALAASVASLAAASPVEQPNVLTIPVEKRHKSAQYLAKDIVSRDQSRLAHYHERAAFARGEREFAPRAMSGTVTNADVSYIAPVQICSTTYNLIVDTGSSNTWAGAGSSKPSSCGTAKGGSVSVTYGSGQFSGTERTGPVSFAGLKVPSQSFASATKASGFNGVDGIFGVGPVVLTQGTASGLTQIPTWMDNLYAQKIISTEVLGVSFVAESGSDTDDANGELTIGGTDSTKFTGPIAYFPKSTTSPYSYYWGIATSGMTYGTTSLKGAANAIVDTGTTLIYLPTSAYTAFLTAAKGTTDSHTGLAKFATKPTQNFTIKFGSTSFVLTPAQYLVPSGQYNYYGLSSGSYYSWINDGGSNAADVNFIIGQKFLEHFYSAFDTTNKRIGFAPSAL